jgi:hypothetical protein
VIEEEICVCSIEIDPFPDFQFVHMIPFDESNVSGFVFIFTKFFNKMSRLICTLLWNFGMDMLMPHYIRCSHFKVDDVSALEASSKLPVRIVEDNVIASLH